MVKFLHPIYKRLKSVGATPEHQAFLEAIDNQLSELEDDVKLMVSEMKIKEASGGWLDAWGDWYGVKRPNRSTSDDEYREFILREVTKPRNTIPGIVEEIERHLPEGSTVRVHEPYVDIFRFNISEMNMTDRIQDERYTRHAVIDIIIDGPLPPYLADIVHEVKAAGIKVYFTRDSSIWDEDEDGNLTHVRMYSIIEPILGVFTHTKIKVAPMELFYFNKGILNDNSTVIGGRPWVMNSISTYYELYTVAKRQIATSRNTSFENIKDVSMDEEWLDDYFDSVLVARTLEMYAEDVTGIGLVSDFNTTTASNLINLHTPHIIGDSAVPIERYFDVPVHKLYDHGEREEAELYAGTPTLTGLMAWYDFTLKDNYSPGRERATDLSGNGNHATLQNFNFTEGSGYKDGELVFDGVDDKLALPELGLDPTGMSVNDSGKVYSYEDDKVLAVGEDGEVTGSGKNLLLSSDIPQSSSEYILANYTYSEKLELDEPFTATIKVKLGEGAQYPRFYNTGGHVSGAFGIPTKIQEFSDGTTVWKISDTWKIANAGNDFLRVYQAAAGDTYPVSTVEWCKLERGTTDTPHVPSSSDYTPTNLTSASLSKLQLHSKPLTKEEMLHNAGVKPLKELKPGVVVQDGLVLHYDFSHETNTSEYKDKAFDYSGNGNHGTLQNFNLTEESGYSENKLSFDGVDDYVEENQPFYEKYTSNGIAYLEATISIPTTHRQSVVSAHYYNFDMAVEAGNRISFWFGDSEHRNKYQLLNAISPDWDYTKGTHVIGVLRDFQNNEIKFYVNGKEVQVYTLVEHDRDTTFQPYPINIGKRSGVMNQFTGGNIHSAKVYLNRVLTPEEIQHNYAIEKEKFGLE